jgi:hypothetical protein
MSINRDLNRRTVLRGMMGGAAVSVGLPFLDMFLNNHGTALADGTALPPCFGVWFQGLAFNPGRWEPAKVGAGYDMNVELEMLAPFKDRINIFSGLRMFIDANPFTPHLSGQQAILQGGLNKGGSVSDGGFGNGASKAPSIDQLIADVIGTRTRFRSLEVACDGSPASYSRRSATAINPSEPSPLALYTRIFGPDFKDPNAADFTPDPRVMVRRSVLSAVGEQSQGIMKQVGASDRARLDEYFTSLRELEKKLEIEMQRPAPMPSCSVPGKVENAVLGPIIDDAVTNHKLFAGLLAHALACGQTQVINVAFSYGPSGLRKAGSGDTYHTRSHEEAVDPKLGYQPDVLWFQNKCLAAFVDMLVELDKVREGNRTLLDRIVLFHATDVGYAKSHSQENIPLLTVGGAGGRLKTGVHVAAKGEQVTRVGLTLQQAFGVPISTWGSESNQTSKTITEIMA